MSQVTEPCACPVKGIIDVVSKKWTLLIVNSLGIHDTLRFKEIQNMLGVNPKTLSDTLKILVKQGIANRVSYTASRDDDIQEPCMPGCKRHIKL